MSIKDLFAKPTGQITSTEKLDNLYKEVESKGFVEEIALVNERFMPLADFTNPANFARYGSAEKYYEDAITNIYQRYPYDGSKKEQQEWRNNSSQLDLYVFDNIYPKSTGYVTLSGSSGNAPYIKFYGGPNNNSDSNKLSDVFKYANIYDPEKNRASNLALNPNALGNTVEFWYKSDDTTSNKTILDLWNGITRFKVTVLLDQAIRIHLKGTENANPFESNPQFPLDSISNFSLASWNHYAFVFKNDGINATAKVQFYLNGKLQSEMNANYFLKDVDVSGMVGTIGVSQGNTFGTISAEESCVGSIDELRFWKEARTSQQIGRYWNSSVGGGSNTDDSNTELGIYYKFNEGITGETYIDSKVLDYSGRVSNGTIINYSSTVRNTGSAINEYGSQIQEIGDPILYSSHPSVVEVLETYKASGSIWDNDNNANILKSIPTWIIEDQQERGSEDLNNLTQIISSYFDTLHLQIDNLTSLRDIKYYSDDEKPKPFINKILSSYDFDTVELFNQTTFIEHALKRNEDQEYEKSLSEIKNAIYQNIYNNLSYIYKSKGTEKSLRNLIRCFGIDDELVKINIYANNSKYKLSNGTRESYAPKKFIDFNHINRFGGFVYSVDTLKNVAEGNQYVPLTVQAEVIFPEKLEGNELQLFPFLTASLFGCHQGVDGDDLSWIDDKFSFCITAEKVQNDELSAKFRLSGCFDGHEINLTSSVFNDVYNNEKWNLAVRIKNKSYPLVSLVSGSKDNDYEISFVGVNSSLGTIQESFILTGSIPNSKAIEALNVEKRLFAGSHYQNFDINYPINKTDVKISSVRYWYDFLNEEEIKIHSIDPSSFGRLEPSWHTLPYNNFLIPKAQTLALNWDFDLVTSSNSNGEFDVEDASPYYASAIEAPKKDYPGKAKQFPANSDEVVNKEFLQALKQQAPETISERDLIEIRDQDDLNIGRAAKPTTYVFSIEKSMYQIINDEILKWFASMNHFNNLFGIPLDRYKNEYKELVKMREIFFENVKNNPDFERFLEFYKWIDSSISIMMEQLIPASANISRSVRNMVESHLLERNKYQNKLPLITNKIDDKKIVETVTTNVSFKYSEQFAPNSPAGSKWEANRVERTSPLVATGIPEIDENREIIRKVKTNRNLNVIPKSYDPIKNEYYENKADKTRMFSDVAVLTIDKQKDPVDAINTYNIENNKLNSDFIFSESMLTASGQLFEKQIKQGNYKNKYEIFQTSGRKDHNIGIATIADKLNITASNIFGFMDRELPERPIVKTVIVERFSAPGGPEVNSRGSMDAASEEYSVYNSINNRNLVVRKQLRAWLAESSSIDPENVSYHKVPKNSSYYKTNGIKISKYDNEFITHQIPQSDSQYAWVTASMVSEPSSSGFFSEYDNLNVYNDIEFLTSSTRNSSVIDKTSIDLDTNTISINTTNPTLDSYQGAGWKFVRNADNKIAEISRKNNNIVVQEKSKTVTYRGKNGVIHSRIIVKPQSSIKFKEPPVEFNKPNFYEVSYSGSKDNLKIFASHDNNINKLANEDLIDFIGIKNRTEKQFHQKLIELSNSNIAEKPSILKTEYSNIVLPRKDMIGLKEVRTKPNYDDNGFTGSVVDEKTFWRNDSQNRLKQTSSFDMFNFSDNKYAELSDTYTYIYNNSPTVSLGGFNNYRESIYSTDFSSSKNITIVPSSQYNINYNSYNIGNLAKNTLAEEKYFILNNINYYMNNFVTCDLANNRNFYNIKGTFDYYKFLTSSDGSTPVSINSIVSSSEGIYLGGKFKVITTTQENITRFNGNSFDTLVNTPAGFNNGSGIYCMVSSTVGLYVGRDAASGGGSGLFRYNGSSWTDLNAPFAGTDTSVKNMISCSAGIIVAVDSTGSLVYEPGSGYFRDLNCVYITGSSGGWKQLGNFARVGAADSQSDNGRTLASVGAMTSGSDGLYVGLSYLRIQGLEWATEIKKIRKFNSSLNVNDTTSMYASVNSNNASDYLSYCTSLLSCSAGLYIAGRGQIFIYLESGGQYSFFNLNTPEYTGDSFLKITNDYEIKSLALKNNDLYIAGSFLSDVYGNRFNGIVRYTGGNIKTNQAPWFPVGGSYSRSGMVFKTGDKINCLALYGDKLYIGGQFDTIRSGPKLKDITNKYQNIVEGFSYKQNDSLSGKLLNPHPQLFFNNFIPPLSGSFKIDEVVYNNSNISLINNFTASSAGVFILNEGFVYETDKISGKKPFFDSYEEFVGDIKPINQKYSIIPEYNISNYMKFYLDAPDGFNSVSGLNYLNLNGSFKESNFNSDNKFNISNLFSIDPIIDNNYENNDTSINIKISGLKKLLPKKDFYPNERVLTLSKYFIDSFLNTNISITSSFNLNDKFNSTLSNNTPINGQILTLLQPLFAPGILLNTIKSSIAVDWPIYISGSNDADRLLNFYSHTGSNLITKTVKDSAGFGQLDNSYMAPNYIDKDPTLRLPFEALINFDSVIPENLKNDNYNLYYLNPTHYTSDIINENEYDEFAFPSYNLGAGSLKQFKFKDPNYQLAMHNFLAEIPNLFLKNKLTKFVSSKSSVYVTAGKEYSMDVVLEKDSQYKSYITDPYYENKKSDVSNLVNGTFLIPSVDSLYGPPMRYWNGASNCLALFNAYGPHNLYFRLYDSPAYASYVPPYHYGKSIARIKFVPDSSREYSIKEILEKVSIEYINNDMDEMFKKRSSVLDANNSYTNYQLSPAYKNRMMLSSSINLKMTTTVLQPEYNPDNFQANKIQTTTNDKWVIQTKFETPSINFSDASLDNNVGVKFSKVNIDGYNVNGVFSNYFKGLWTTYGKPATQSNGITLKIQNSPNTTQNNSLAALCGFETDTQKQIGAIGNNKKITEAVVIIPFSTEKNHGNTFDANFCETIPAPLGETESNDPSLSPFYFKIDRNILKEITGLSFDKNSKVTFEQIKTKVESSGVDENNSIIKMLKSMVKFVLPPHLDWLRNKSIDPFVMYLAEFNINLDTEDLSDIWQGLMPKASYKPVEESIIITHKLLPNELFHGKKMLKTVKFKMFKVKQRANINYYELTENSADDSGFEFKFGNSQQAQRPQYSYNWPYDFCSVVEYVSVEAGLSIDKTKK